MSFDEFIKKYLGKKIDFDDFYQGQCVDLYRQYVKEVLGYPQSPGVGGAAEIWYSASPEYYDFIKNDPLAIPQAGDIVIWNRRVGGGFGHVAIFVEGNVNQFTSFDQNWPTLNKCTLTKHNYKNITGWMRPKKQLETGDYLKDIRIKELEDELIKLKEEYAEEQKRLIDCREDRKELGIEVERLRSQLQTATEDFQREKKALQIRNEEEKKRFNDLLRNLAVKLDTAQNEPEIYEAIETLIGHEDNNDELNRKLTEANEKLTECNSSALSLIEQASDLAGVPLKSLEGVLGLIYKLHQIQNNQPTTIEVEIPFIEKIIQWLKKLLRR